jgi:hypothetical protein
LGAGRSASAAPGRRLRGPRRGRWPRAGPDDRHALVLEGLGQTERGLAAELDDDAGDRAGVPARRAYDLEHVLEGERLEVETAARVVVGGHRLGVAVDHDRVVARVAQGEGGVHAGVVELDALTDPVRARAEDEHGRPLPGGDLGSPRRRCCSGRASAAANSAAQVSTVLKTGRTPSAWRTPRTTASGMPRAARRSGRRRTRAAWPGAAARAEAFGGCARLSAISLMRARSGRGTTGRCRWPRGPRSTSPPRSGLLDLRMRPSVGRLAMASSSRLLGRSRALAVASGSPRLPLRSMERSAFWSASVKLRPMAIASPTDFIVVVSVSSAAGNFSKANRGTLTTT